jgi:hypothetical protein
MISLALRAAGHFGKALLLLDRYFLSVPALKRLQEGVAAGAEMEIVVKAKKNCVAYEPPPPRKPGQRGRPRKHGAAVKLASLFDSAKDRFVDADLTLYGKPEHVRWLCVDYLWGARLYRKLRFVLVSYGGVESILATTDLTLAPERVIALYAMRFSVECMFKELKQTVGALAYRFWTKSMEKLDRYRKKGSPAPLGKLEDAHAREMIGLAIKATEGYVFCGSVALGLHQMAAMRYSGSGELEPIRYMRTKSNAVLSEATVADYLRRNIFWLLAKNANLAITRIILSKGRGSFYEREAS